MIKIEIELTGRQEIFLKEFAEKHYDGAKDNLITADAIHVVQSKRDVYIPYSSDIVDHFSDLPLTFTTDEDYELWYEDEIELIQDYYERKEEDCPIEIKPFKSYSYYTTVEGEDEYVIDIDDYFEVYGVKIVAAAWKSHEWSNEAFFFIRDEAKRYIEYQRHNLKKPRIYTYSAGYANKGDFIPFRELLLTMGKQLNEGGE